MWLPWLGSGVHKGLRYTLDSLPNLCRHIRLINSEQLLLACDARKEIADRR